MNRNILLDCLMSPSGGTQTGDSNPGTEVFLFLDQYSRRATVPEEFYLTQTVAIAGQAGAVGILF